MSICGADLTLENKQTVSTRNVRIILSSLITHKQRGDFIATTAFIAVHTGRSRKVHRAFQEILGYVKNPDKTKGGELVTGYACDPLMAEAQFTQAKAEYYQKTGRRREWDDVIGYHLRQSFVPGEITPEEANRLGQELARRFTKGQHAFIVATHTDKAHIHNHIIISAVNLDCDRKFRDFRRSAIAIRRLSDTICLENGYSIIEKPQAPDRSKGRSIWNVGRNPPTQRDDLREAIDIALTQRPKDMEALLQQLIFMGWEVKRGKHIALRKPDQKRFKRMDSLGEDYTQEALVSIMQGNQPHAPKRKKSMNKKQEHRMALLADIQRKMRDRNSPAYTRWSKVFYAKQMANTRLYMSENNLDDVDVISRAAAASARCDELTEQIQQADTRMRALTELRQHIFNYNKTREVYLAYARCSPRDRAQFAAEHQHELELHRAAKKAFDALEGSRLPTVKEINAEFETLRRQKGKLYGEYQQAKKERAELLTIRANLELILDRSQHEIEQEAQRNDR